MGCSSRIVLVAILGVFAMVAPTILAKDFVVGDDNGWKNNNFDYKAWAQGKEFHVGDKLIFKYKAEAHNVYKVDQAGFQDCKAPAGVDALDTGDDEITISSPGKKWYICGIGSHCESGGMKLAINVLPTKVGGAAAPAPSTTTPAPSGAAPQLAPAARFAALVIAPFLIIFAIMA